MKAPNKTNDHESKPLAQATQSNDTPHDPRKAPMLPPVPNKNLDAALMYADSGFPVFPCKPGDKKPATPNGLKNATTDLEQIEMWWGDHPTWNVGIRTDGLIVIDIDGSDNPWLKVDVEKLLELSGAPTSRTPGGGSHHFYRQPEGKNYCNTVGKLAPNVDTRANGGYVVVSPSVIVDGKSYSWAEGGELDVERDRLPEPPEWLVKKLDALAIGKSTSTAVATTGGPGRIVDGERNSSLARLAGVMRRAGFLNEAIDAALRLHNAKCCVPPLSDDEVHGIAKSISKYPPETAGPKRSARVTNLNDVETKPYEWLWEPFIAVGKLCMMVGHGGEGKSTLTCALAAAITTGDQWPDDSGRAPEGTVLFMSAEDSPADTIKPRLEAAGADVTKVSVIEMAIISGTDGPKEEFFDLGEHLDILDGILAKQTDCKMVVMDPISAYMGGVDSHKNTDVRSILGPLSDLAERHEVAVIGITHFNKKSEGSAAQKVMGSTGFTAAPRTVLSVIRDPKDSDCRIMAIIKSNIGCDRLGIRFRLRFDSGWSRVEWIRGRFEIDVDEMSQESSAKHQGKSAVDEAADWLRQQLPPGIPKPTEDVRQAADAGHKWRTIETAKKRLGIESVKLGGFPKGRWGLMFPEDRTKNPGESSCGLQAKKPLFNGSIEDRNTALPGENLRPSDASGEDAKTSEGEQ